MGIVAIFGGTFNPIHIGHNEIISHLNNISDIEKIILIPTKIPPHKNTDFLADAEHRYNMCKIIASNYSNVEVSDIELYREGKSYTIDTVKALESKYKNQKLALTIGGDMLVSFDCWKDYKEILKKCVLITFKRTGISDIEYFNSIEKLRCSGANILDLDFTITDVSSTKIRNDFSINLDSNLVDKRVKNYILENNLYGV